MLALILLVVLGVYCAANLIEKKQDLHSAYKFALTCKSEEIKTYVKGHFLAIQILSEQISEIYASPDLEKETKLKKLVERTASYNEGFAEVFLKCDLGQFSSHNENLTIDDVSFKEQLLWNNVAYQKFVKSTVPIVSPLTKGRHGEKNIFIAMPIRIGQGQYCGYVLGSLKMEKIEELLEKKQCLSPGYFVLLDQEQQVLYHPEQKTKLLSEALLPVLKVIPEKTQGLLDCYSPLYNCEESVHFMTIEDLGWVIWVAVPRLVVLFPFYRDIILFSVAFLMGIFLILFIREMLLKRIALPLTQLNNASKEIAAGYLSSGVDLTNKKVPQEISELSARFKAMVLNLEKTKFLLKRQGSILEKQAAEHSQELLMKNKEMVALCAVASSVSNTYELADILNQVFNEIMKLFEAEFVTIYLPRTDDYDHEYIHTVWRVNYPRKEKTSYVKCISSYSKLAVEQEKIVVIEDLQKSTEDVPLALRWSNMKSLVSIPFYYQNMVSGAITLTSCYPRHFGEQELAILQTVGNQLGVIITNFVLLNVISEKHQILLAIINSMHEGLILLDSKGKIIYGNPLFFQVFHLEKVDERGEMFIFELQKEINPEVKVVLPYEELKERFLKRQVFEHGQISITYQEKTKYYLIQGFPVNTSKTFLGYGYVICDITREKEVDNLKSSILSTVSHELRSPLTTIYGSAESLLRKDVVWTKEEQVEFIEAIVEESKRLRELIDNIMDMSKIEAGFFKLDLYTADIGKVIERVMKRVRNRFPENNFAVEIAEKIPYVLIDERRIEQVLNNLLENAIKYSPVEKNIQVKISHLKEEGMIKVGVIDSGIGIAPQDHQAIFERFYRLENARSIRTKGSGVGLSIAKGIIENHGGRLWVESELGLGSKFYFTLPCAKAKEGRK